MCNLNAEGEHQDIEGAVGEEYTENRAANEIVSNLNAEGDDNGGSN